MDYLKITHFFTMKLISSSKNKTTTDIFIRASVKFLIIIAGTKSEIKNCFVGGNILPWKRQIKKITFLIY